MAIEETKQNTISKINTGFPAYLDFDKLRSEGIAYLAQLSGKIWSDHNVHDPGITIFETLCYALLDLGYRTNLPVADLLTRDPSDKTTDTNFYTPAQILTNNPLTITDYRKLLIDIPQVKNAWLDVITDITDICLNSLTLESDNITRNKSNNPENYEKSATSTSCTHFINGLYRVFIETEKNPETDFNHPAEADQYKKAVISEVKKSLMAHRNLCEDFEEIYLLCKQPIGVCASVELENEADAENTYIAIINALTVFLSPSPEFYTLPELLEKGKDISDIFAGRPFCSKSHGFVDTNELENIHLKKEIHLSDVYQSMFAVPGVKRVSGLELSFCGTTKCIPESKNEVKTGKTNSWKLKLPENHVPFLSIRCSGISFSKNGQQIAINSDKLESLFDLQLASSGKVLYEMPSPKLDTVLPRGNFHPAIESYYSIQNDFPRVYGISEGSLPNDASDARKAWALQLKGYLLFFDQFLANYLSQLKNIRQLFSLSGPQKESDRHTYFVNRLSTVPEMEKLLRFNSTTTNALGSEGSLLVKPIPNTAWEKEDIKTKYAEHWLNHFEPFTFLTLNELDDAVSLLRNELQIEGETTINTWQASDDCWLFTLKPSTASFILLGEKSASSQNEALRMASTVLYTGLFEENYRTFLTKNNNYTFHLALHLNDYTQYLSLMVENREIYVTRRKQFLSHLFARFAENFTDFVLLNWKAGQEMEGITHAERFLSHYDEISRNRGRGYDYFSNKWDNDNISGFEKKVKVLAGMSSLKKADLCHFTVDLYDEQYIIEMSPAGDAYFLVNEKFDRKEKAEETVERILSALSKKAAYRVDPVNKPGNYTIYLDYGGKAPAVYHRSFPDSRDAEEQASFLHRVIARIPHPEAVTEYTWKWRAHIHNNEGHIFAIALEKWDEEDAADKGIKRLVSEINNTNKWETSPKRGETELISNNGRSDVLLDIQAFNIDINNTIIGKPGKYTYEVLDKSGNTFKICPLLDFDNASDAKKHCIDTLFSGLDETNYSIRINKETGKFRVLLGADNSLDAFCVTEYETKSIAEKSVRTVAEIIQKFSYTLSLEKSPETWKFRHLLKTEGPQKVWLYSENEYTKKEDAAAAAVVLSKNINSLSWREAKAGVLLVHQSDKTIPRLQVKPEIKDGENKILKDAFTKEQKLQDVTTLTKETINRYISVDGPGRFNTYVYRLVNKNRIPASFNRLFSDQQSAWKGRLTLLENTRKKVAAIPEICYGGNIFREVKSKGNRTYFRYQLKVHGITGKIPGETVVFESVEGYSSKESAQKAFEENYMKLLHYGGNIEAYGKSISLVPLPLPEENSPNNSGAIVFVPSATRKLLEQYQITWEQLADYLIQYPVQRVGKDTPEFASLFCTDPVLEKQDPCSKNDKKWVYYFRVGPLPASDGDKKSVHYWNSTTYYSTPNEAKQEYLYFKWLLQFAGNLFTECGCISSVENTSHIVQKTGWKIGIREVLAQSVNWYASEEDAWGKKGVEQFICALQTEKSVHQYENTKNCCSSFYITCEPSQLEHPCRYDTAQKRNTAINKLFEAVSHWKKDPHYWYQQSDKNNLLITGDQGMPFARLNPETLSEINECELLTIIAEKTRKETSGSIKYDQQTGFLTLSFENSKIQFLSIDKQEKAAQDEDITNWIRNWSDQWKKWGCFFPITRTCYDNCNSTDEKEKKYKYCVELKLPGFNNCKEDEPILTPCTCTGEPTDKTVSVAGPKLLKTPFSCTDYDFSDTPGCYIAWKSACCFTNCYEAVKWYIEALELLRNRNNYQPVFDCSCQSFGINLHSNRPMLYDPHNIEGARETTQASNSKQSQIIALNPQCYPTAEETCKAVETAKKLLNSEGMHLAEHILLRPHCETDCCDTRIRHCESDCVFPPYLPGEKNPCESSPQKICFEPGVDPYSFIATVVLPAWSLRFRNTETRQILENLLYKETPAHVLLRILWLRPVDFCRFEQKYKQWNRWLAGKENCPVIGPNDELQSFDTCQFIELLFNTPYDCMETCNDCIPCKDPSAVPENPCITKKKETKKSEKCYYTPEGDFRKLEFTPHFPFLNQINRRWCFESACIPRPEKSWKEVDCKQINEIKDQAELKRATGNSAAISNQTAKETKERKVKKSAIENEITPKTSEPEAKAYAIQDKAKIINARIHRYRSIPERIASLHKGNTLAEKMIFFLQTPYPETGSLEKIIREVIQNEKPKKGKPLTKALQQDLIKAAFCCFLDKICFNGKDDGRIKTIQSIATHVAKAGFDMQTVYNYWDAAEVGKYEPETDTDFVRVMITGKK